MAGFPHLPRGKKQHVPWGGPWPTRMLKVGGITHQSLQSRMLKPGWIGGPTKWICHIGGWNSLPSQGWRTQRNLLRKICVSFSIPAVRSKAFPGQGYTVPPAPRCLTQNVFLPNDLSYQDIQQQPFLLTMAYAQGLQYWAERFHLPANPRFLHLLVKEHPGTKGEGEGACHFLQTRCHPGLGKD